MWKVHASSCATVAHPPVSPHAHAQVTDFGLSQKLAPNQSHLSNARHGMALYAAPELLQSGRASFAADVVRAWPGCNL